MATMGWTGYLAASIGAPEAGLKLVLGQIAGYPVLLFYRKYLADKESNLQHLYFFLTGLFLGHWVIGEGVTHSLYSILATYLILLISGGTIASVVFSFLINLAYLLAGYWYMAGEDYDVSWTMPQCVLCLRLIGLTWDVYDGERQKLKPESLSKDQTKTALSSPPNILEMLSHSFFIGGYFVGPQFPLRKFREIVSPKYQSSLPNPGPCRFAFIRLLLGVGYMTFHVIGSIFLPNDWPVSQDFFDRSLGSRLLFLPLWCKFILAKYISMWLFAEGVCAISGLSYQPAVEGEEKEPDWKGCANVRLTRLESATRFAHYIEAFNINTNAWAMDYVYKRLKFVGSKHISQMATLAFLAVWHGWHSGYYLLFFNEFIVVNFERDWAAVWAKSPVVKRWRDHPAFNTVTNIVGWVYLHFFLPHCFMPFPLLWFEKYWPAYKATLFVEYLFFMGWVVWGQGVKMWLLSGMSRKEEVDLKKTK